MFACGDVSVVLCVCFSLVFSFIIIYLLFSFTQLRANIQPGLLAMHTLWLREHNRLARALIHLLALETKTDVMETTCGWCDNNVVDRISSTLGIVNASEFDELIFQEVRRILIAEFQIVTYKEYLPALLGHDLNENNSIQYDEQIHASVSNTFATAAMRFGHTQVHDMIGRVYANGTVSKPLQLRKTYFATSNDIIERFGGLDSMLRSMLAADVTTTIESSDETLCENSASRPCVSNEIREFLFGSDQRILLKKKGKRRTGTDLIAVNIQRGRDHGLPDYNTVLSKLLAPITSFEEVSSNFADTLSHLYDNDVNNIDLFVGMSVEKKKSKNDHIGPLASRLLENQFRDLISGDRFFYTNEFTTQQVNQMELETSMRNIMKRNTAVESSVKLRDSDVFIII